MAAHFFLDASALSKRYLSEFGSANINHLFQSVTSNRLCCLSVGMLEVISVLVRARNRGTIMVAEYQQTSINLRAEVIDNKSSHASKQRNCELRPRPFGFQSTRSMAPTPSFSDVRWNSKHS